MYRAFFAWKDAFNIIDNNFRMMKRVSSVFLKSIVVCLYKVFNK